MTTLPPLTLDDLIRLDRRTGPAERGFGALTSAEGHLPLVAMAVSAGLTGLVSALAVRQTFRNCHPVAIEATYIFPLPDGAAVTDLAVTLAGRRVIAELKERQAARDAYDDAIEAGKRATIVEEERPDVFTLRVGNLAPGEEAVVELTLAGRLACEDGEATFRFPLVVAPRYMPGQLLEGPSVGDGTALDTDRVPDASRISPPVLLPGVPNPVRLSLSATVDPAGLAVSDLRSSLHAVTTSGALPGRISVEIQPGERLDRDFVLRYRVAEGAAVSAIAVPDADGEEGTYVVTVLPPARASASVARREVVVVLDRSGSMGGWKMVAARRAAARIIDSLRSQDHFAVLAFDNVAERPPATGDGRRLVAATDRNRYLAVEWLARLEARGGTELASAMTEALADFTPAAGEGSRCCVVVTDGQVGDDSELIRAASRTGGVRLFTVGIDQAVNASLLRRLAEVSGGTCDLIESEDRLDEVMTALHRRINHPAMEQVTVALPGMSVLAGTASPRSPTDVFAGVPLILAGRYCGRPAAKSVVSAHADGSPVTLESPVTVVDSHAAGAVWARAHLRDLEDRYASAPPGADLDGMSTEIVAVSLRHRVLCRFTAFVAIDSSGELVGDHPHSIVQPVEMPSGWGLTSGGPIPMRTARAPEVPRALALPAEAFSMPAQAAGAGRIRLPGRQSGGGRFRPYDEVDPYQQRLADLLVRLGDGTGDGLTELAAEARNLADELRSKGAPADLSDAVDALAAALTAGDRTLIRTLAEELRSRDPGRQRWWRR